MPVLIGSPVLRVEDLRLLKGRGQYVDDISLDGMLHAAVFRSSVAHGRIRSLDVSRAKSLPGVVAVLTFGDIADFATPIPIRIGGMPNFDKFLQLPLAHEKVRYVGEPIAFIVAESAYLAEDALGLIAVEIEALPAIVDWETASRADALVHEAAGSNLTAYTVARGDAAAAFENAPYVRRERFSYQRHAALPMETRGLVAVWDAENSHMHVLGATKIPFFNRRVLAQMLKLPETSVDQICLDVGGSFGVRGEFYPEDFLVPFAARMLNRPIKWIEDRREHLMATNHARDLACDLEIACARDGTILAMRAAVFADIGAYARGTGGTSPSRAAQFLPGPYRIANFTCQVHGFVSNKTPAGSYRGPGRVEANFFRERLLDMASADLEIGRDEIRRRNLVTSREMPYPIGRLVTYEEPVEYDSGDFLIPFERVLTEIGWVRKQAIQGRCVDGWHQGLGLACFVESNAGGPGENARIQLLADGRLQVFVGSTNSGQGHETVLAQVCGDVLGIPFDQIEIVQGSTNVLSEGFGTYHSRSGVMAGNAVAEAAQNFIEILRLLAAAYFGRPNVELSWDQGRYHRAGSDVSVGLAELAHLAASRNESVEALGNFKHTGKKPFTYGSHAAHVAVDVKTGRVRVVDYVAVEDVGRAINPLLVHGQAIGGIVQGMGGAFLEHLHYDEQGQLLTASLADYLVPTASDFPNLRGIMLEVARAPGNPLGLKGVGEGGVTPVAAAIGNAVSAALAEFSAEVRDMPLSPPRIWHLVSR
jgi:carbon-monoxide dehydrogenase large subunit